MTREELIAQDESMRAAPARQGGIMTKNELERLARNHGTGGWQTLDSMIEFGKAILAKADELRAQAEAMNNGAATNAGRAHVNLGTSGSATEDAAPPSAAQPVECLCCGTTASGVAIQHAECASAVICGSCVEVMRTAPDLAARVARLEAALRLIASCESRAPGDVVDIARAALAEGEK